jgi:ABC-type thiamine transport system ATPase subunit
VTESTPDQGPARLSNFRAVGLFGQFDNNITLRTDQRITAVIGPNGRGKTVCLRLIDAFYKRRLSVFTSTDFDYLRFDFTNGSSVVVKKFPELVGEQPDTEPTASDMLPLELVFSTADKKETSWRPVTRLTDNASPSIIRFVPFITREGPSSWSDDRTGERYTLQDVAERFGDMLPKTFFTDTSDTDPPGFRALTDSVDCHLIETQRLLAIGPGPDGGRSPYEARIRRQHVDARLVVEQKAQKLKIFLQNQLALFGATSQRLDRSFPSRVLEANLVGSLPQSQISDRLRKLEEERKALTKAGLIDVGLGPMLVPEQFDERLSGVLEIYVKDTEEKLSVFAELRRKIDLFVRILSDRFTGKIVDVNQQDGFTLKSEISGKTIPLDKLSSGEQHQLVLLFELLFEMQQDSLILIDEPELSLHVRWQKQFISDLKQIIALNNFDVIIATHSPQLISHWRELIVSLGSVHKA